MSPFLREPLVHFLGLGAVIFALSSLFDDGTAPVAADRIVVTQNDAARLAAQFEATWRRPPDATEMSRLIDAFVREEVLVREALALGLDRGDAVVRQRMAQKITFLAESGAEATPVSDDMLETHLAEHAARFEQPATVAFAQILLRDDVPADAALARLAADGDLSEFMAPTLLPARLDDSPAEVVDATFGTGMFAALAVQAPGAWSGPIESAFGRHLVFVQAHSPARLPPLEEIRDRVELDWRASLREDLVAARIATLLARYEVLRPDMPDAAQ